MMTMIFNAIAAVASTKKKKKWRLADFMLCTMGLCRVNGYITSKYFC